MALLTVPAMADESPGGLETVLVMSCGLPGRMGGFSPLAVYIVWGMGACPLQPGSMNFDRVAPSIWVYPPYGFDLSMAGNREDKYLICNL